MVVAVKSNPEKIRTVNEAVIRMDKKEFIGNCKEFRIESNKGHLKIIGNENKIKLASNSGHLEIIGNATRVKIVNNSGKVSYTGNSGKLYLGRDSPATDVDYIGNNGILKLVNSNELWDNAKNCNKDKSKTVFSEKNSTTSKKSGTSPASYIHQSSENKRRCTSGSDKINDHHHQFCLSIKNNISLPNLDNLPGCTNITSSIEIASGNGSIIVTNCIRA